MAKDDDTRSEESVDVEAIMAEIRRQIQLKRDEKHAPSSQALEGPLSPEFYDALQQAMLSNDQVQPKIVLSETSIPLIGGFIQYLRRNLHQLVMFYIDQLAANQIRFNTQLLQSLILLSEEVVELMDQEPEDA